MSLIEPSGTAVFTALEDLIDLLNAEEVEEMVLRREHRGWKDERNMDNGGVELEKRLSSPLRRPPLEPSHHKLP